MRRPGKIDLAWCAGFFDGEGCVHISNVKSRYGQSRHVLRISVAQKYQGPLKRFQRTVSCGGTIEPKSGGGHQLVYAGEAAARVLSLLDPHLSVKRRQARIAIRFQGMIQHGRNKPLSVSEQRARHRCWEQVKELKK